MIANDLDKFLGTLLIDHRRVVQSFARSSTIKAVISTMSVLVAHGETT